HQELVDEGLVAAAHVGEWRLPPGHAVYALAGHLQESDFARLLRTRNVKDLEAALPTRRVRLEWTALVVDQQHVADHLDLVGMCARGRFELGDNPRAARIFDVNHGRADAALTHVSDEGEAVFQVDVHAVAVTVEIGLSNLAHVQSVGLCVHTGSCHGSTPTIYDLAARDGSVWAEPRQRHISRGGRPEGAGPSHAAAYPARRRVQPVGVAE